MDAGPPLGPRFSVHADGSSFAGHALALSIYAAIAIWAFYISLSGRPVFRDSLAPPD